MGERRTSPGSRPSRSLRPGSGSIATPTYGGWARSSATARPGCCPRRGPRQAAPTLPHEIVLRARSTVPAERFATSAEMQGAIEAAMMTLGLGATHASVGRVREGAPRRAGGGTGRGVAGAAREACGRGYGFDARGRTRSRRPCARFVPRTAPRWQRRERSARSPARPPIAATARTISRTLTRARRSLQPPRGARAALFVTGFSVAVDRVRRARLHRDPGAEPSYERHAARKLRPAPIARRRPPKASCPAGMLEVIAPADRDPCGRAVLPRHRARHDRGLQSLQRRGRLQARRDSKIAGPASPSKERATLDSLCHERDPKAHAREPINCVNRDMAAVFCAAHGARLATEAEVTLAIRQAVRDEAPEFGGPCARTTSRRTGATRLGSAVRARCRSAPTPLATRPGASYKPRPCESDGSRSRSGMANVTQMHYARKGIVTEEMAYVAQREKVDARARPREVARGRLGHPGQRAPHEPRADGHRHRARRARSTRTSATAPSRATSTGELRKLAVALKYGADTVMDLSTGGDIDGIRARHHRGLARADRHRARSTRRSRSAKDVTRHHAPTTSSTCSSTRPSRASTTSPSTPASSSSTCRS